VDLTAHLPPHAIADVLEVHRVAGRRLTAAAAAIKVVGAALRARHALTASRTWMGRHPQEAAPST